MYEKYFCGAEGCSGNHDFRSQRCHRTKAPAQSYTVSINPVAKLCREVAETAKCLTLIDAANEIDRLTRIVERSQVRTTTEP